MNGPRFGRPFQIHLPATPRRAARVLHGAEFPASPIGGPVAVWDPDDYDHIRRFGSVGSALLDYQRQVDGARVIWPEDAA